MEFSAALFRPLIGQSFARVEGLPPLILTEVNDLPGHAMRPAGSFSLMFEGPEATAFPQGLAVLSHEVVGEIELFLVPIKPVNPGSLYEAVFN